MNDLISRQEAIDGGDDSIIQLQRGDCLELMKRLPDKSVDLTVTSPPYDNLRTYNGNISQWSFEKFQQIAKELYRITDDGGVVVWICGDATIKGSETGTSYRQALWFMECGFNLHDTMIWQKTGRIPTQDRYYNVFEFMFVFSKGKPKTMNFICDHKNITAGQRRKKDKCINKGKNEKYEDIWIVSGNYSRRENVWKIHIGKNKDTCGHPAPFPIELAQDHIISWSNKGDTVLDCMMGSGTTGVACVNLKRNFIGMEIEEEYFKIAKERINNARLNQQAGSD